ncbi:SGNH/GDSL hydrolase family protein [Achromobacter sp.]|uniref:SGNH/GDSL hydrolase family protein n=1 Tax=Achromobacter sp. TaxID=134375 RepID=UPI0028B0A5A5|nr:SGNH/GDSL hydrolase family protein [Achromobacter sp.]
MTTPYLSIPQEQVAERLEELIDAAHVGTRVVITRDGMAYAQLRRVNPLLTEEAHRALEELKQFKGVPYVDEATWWHAVKGTHE